MTTRLPTIDGDAGTWGQVLNDYLTEHVVPTGGMVEYAGAAAPAGWLLCDGASYLRTDYTDLFTALGGASSPWGLPDGTHFNVPDMRGRTAVGKGTHADVDALADSDGVAVGSRRPNHNHTVNDAGHTHGFNAGDGSAGATYGNFNGLGPSPVSVPASVQSATTGVTVGPQTNAPTDGPGYLVVNYIVKT